VAKELIQALIQDGQETKPSAVHRTSDKITDLETLQLQEKPMKSTIIQEWMDGSIP
jgi:hypothetical protein